MLEQLKHKFIEEVIELLDKLEKDLLNLEKDTSDEKLVEEIFRVMHTIKGAAGMYGLNKTVKITHKLESIYANIRDKKTGITKNIITTSFNSIDYIRELVESDDKNIKNDDYNNFIEEIERLIEVTSHSNKEPEKKDDDVISLFEDDNDDAISFFENNDEDDEAADVISFFGDDDQDDKDEDKNNDEVHLPKATYYIIFKPEADINDRGLNINSVIEEINDFSQTTKTIEHSYKEGTNENKFFIFWEFFIATEKTEEDVNDIFMFLEDESEIHKLSDDNLLENEEFNAFLTKDFNINEELNIEKLKEFALSFKKELKKQPKKEEKKEEKKTVLRKKVTTGQQQNEIVKQKTQSIKVSSERLDELMYLVSELIITNSQLNLHSQQLKDDKIQKIAEKLNKISQQLKENALSTRLISIKHIMLRFERLVRDLSAELGKEINFVVEGADTELDKNIIDNLSLPLMHLIRNAIDHGIETPEERLKLNKSTKGIVRFIAFYSGSNVIIQIRDDGKGIDPELIVKNAKEKGFLKEDENLSLKEIYNLLFIPGLSTAQRITGISGRGVGMDAIKQSILKLRGDIEIDSEINLGTSITIKLPLTLSIIDTMLVSIDNNKYLIPISNIEASGKHDHEKLMNYPNERLINGGKLIPFIYLRKKFEIATKSLKSERLIFVTYNGSTVALVFDKIIGEHQAVIKPLGEIFKNQDFISGASILGDGTVALILDIYKLVNEFSIINKES